MLNPLFTAAIELEYVCCSYSWDFCFIGGIAVQRWGQPRLTRDVDLTLLTEIGEEEAIIDQLLGHYPARMPDAREFALLNRVLLLTSTSGVPLDVALGVVPFEQRSVARASPFVLDGNRTILTCSAEDLIVHKAFADRPQDWLDIEGILMRHGSQLNQNQVWIELEPLVELKEEPAILDRLRSTFTKYLLT